MIFRLKVLSRVRTIHPKLGVFSKMFKIQLFCCFITQLVKKLQQWSLYEVIEDIMLIVLNTKRPLSDIWLLSYKQNSFGCFQRNSEVIFFLKHPKLFCLYLSNQISLRGCFVFKTMEILRISIVWVKISKTSILDHIEIICCMLRIPIGMKFKIWKQFMII